MRFVLVPSRLLLMPQMFAVLVKLLRVDEHRLAFEARGDAERGDDLLEPHRAAAHFADFERDPAARARDAVELGENRAASPPPSRRRLRMIVMRRPISSASRPLNQQRSQLSFAYCTTSRNGGEVTVSCTLLSRIARVARPAAFEEARVRGGAPQPLAVGRGEAALQLHRLAAGSARARCGMAASARAAG